MGRREGSRCPSHTTGPCKIRNFAKKGTSFPEPLVFLVFTDLIEEVDLYDM